MPGVSREDMARAILILRRRRRERQQEAGPRIDPIARLMDPAFTEQLWEYEHSRIDPFIPGILHTKQLEALTTFSQHRWLFWGNQAGKTTLGAVDIVLKALGRHPWQLLGLTRMPPRVSWASALSWELWENILLPELLTWIPVERVIGDPPPANKRSTRRDILIRADNGATSRITGKAAEQGAKAYQSARVDDVWIDEEHPQDVYDEMQPRLLRHGGTTLATMTPLKGETTYVFVNIYRPARDGQLPRDQHWYSHAGVADNPGIPALNIERMVRDLQHSPSQLEARLHGKFVKPVGIVYKFDLGRDGVDLEGEALKDFVRRGRCYGQFDLGKWRWAFAFWVQDKDGVLVLVDEVFSQDETADVRAKRVHTLLKAHGVREIMIWGECADPDELWEINEALERIDSPFRFWPVDMKHKNRRKGIQRVENLLSRGALKVRRGCARGAMWRLGMNAGSAGVPMEGSRWIWEVNNWQYPEMPDGKVQTDDPDDATADGADMMDGTRYLVLRVYGELEDAEVTANVGKTTLQRIAEEIEELDSQAGSNDASRFGDVLRQG